MPFFDRRAAGPRVPEVALRITERWEGAVHATESERGSGGWRIGPSAAISVIYKKQKRDVIRTYWER